MIVDGRYLIERQDGYTDCEHPLCDTLHRRFHVHSRLGDWTHPIRYVSWHVWDAERDDYAADDCRFFETKREATVWLAGFLEDRDRQAEGTA